MKTKLLFWTLVILLTLSLVSATEWNGTYYPFNSNTLDNVGTNGLSLSGGAAITTNFAKLGSGSLDLTSVDDYATNSSFGTLLANLSHVKTIDFWINWTAITTDDTILFTSNGVATKQRIWLDGISKFEFYTNPPNTAIDNTTTPNLDSTWQHYIIRWNDTDREVWTNGWKSASIATGHATQTDLNNLFLGFESGVGSGQFRIDNLFLSYDYYTPDMIAESYNSGAGTDFTYLSNTVGVTLLSPVNNNYNATNPIKFIYNVTSRTADLDDCVLYTNSSGWSINATDLNPTNNTDNNLSLTLEDGTYSWNIVCNDTLGNVATGTSNYTLTVDSMQPYITLQNQYVTALDHLETQFTITDDNLYSINITDETGQLFYNISYSGTELLYNLSINTSLYGPGWHNVTIIAADGHTAKSIKDYKFSKDIIDNAVTFKFDTGYVTINPEGLTGSLQPVKKIDRYSFDYTRSSYNDKNKAVFYITSNEFIDILEGDSKYNAHLVVPSLNKWIDFNIEDATGKEKYQVERISSTKVKVTITGTKQDAKITFNSIGDLNVNTATFSWYKAVATHNLAESAAENTGQTVTLLLNTTGLTGYYDSLNMTLLYDSTVYKYSTKTIYPTYTQYTYSVTTPAITEYVETHNISFKLQSVYLGNETVSYMNVSQQVFKLLVAECSDPAFNYTAMTIYGYDEDAYNESVDFTINAEFSFYLNLTSTNISYQSMQFTGANNYSVCITTNSTDFYTDTTLEYYATDYANRKYYLYQYLLDSTNKTLKLYLLNQSKASDIVHTVYDRFGTPQPNIFVKVLRYYPELGQSLVVEIGKTDNEGKTGTKQVLVDVFYSYMLQQGTNTLQTTSAGRLLSTTKYFFLSSQDNPIESNKNLVNVDRNIIYDTSTQTFTLTWNDVTGLTNTVCLEVKERSAFGDTEICNAGTNCLAAASGNLNCVVPGNASEKVFVATGYIETNTLYSNLTFAQAYIDLGTKFQSWGVNGLFSGLLLICALALAMSFSGVGIIFATMLGIIALMLLKVLPLGWISAIVLMILGGILMSRMRS